MGSITSSTITTTPQYQTEIALNMSDDDMGEEYPTTIDHMKTSPSTSPRSAPLRENSVILEARDAGQHGQAVYVMPLPPQGNGEVSPAFQAVSTISKHFSPPAKCQIQILEEPEEKFRYKKQSEEVTRIKNIL